ncbi:MAG: 50S ribosomal protein L29 [Patescibacteria group bacterium]
MGREIKDLRGKTSSELQKMLKKHREVVRDLRFKDSNRQLKNVRSLRKAKETIAQILTVINEKTNEKRKQAK